MWPPTWVASETGVSDLRRTRISTAARSRFRWARSLGRIEYQCDGVGRVGTKATGISSQPRPVTRRGAISRCSNIYRRIEDWHGAPDPDYRGTGGPVFVEPAPGSQPDRARHCSRAARAVGIPTFENQNGRDDGGRRRRVDHRSAGRDGHRQSVFRSYVSPVLDRPNLTVITGALVTRLTFDGHPRNRCRVRSATASPCAWARARKWCLSLGAIHTPKLLMQSGIGDAGPAATLRHPGRAASARASGRTCRTTRLRLCLGVPAAAGAAQLRRARRRISGRAIAGLEGPDLQTCQAEVPMSSAENVARFGLPEFGWTLFAGVVRPKSRGASG